jgi:cyanophycinase
MSILERFIELAGGKDAPIVVIPTASGEFSEASLNQKLNMFRDLGATHVTPLHTTDPAEANENSFVEPLKSAKGVWFGGGRQWRLVDSYKNTKVEKLLWEVLERGGVIGGSSAGASIQGSYLARGDTSGNQVMTGDHEVGFGYLRNVAIDQHLLARNRHFDMFTILKQYPHLLGFGIDENTAMVVRGDEFEVMGESYVVVYDGTFWSREGTRLPRG